MKHYGDICKLNGAAVEPVWVITGGSPCQDLSLANGERKGLGGERSGLFHQMVRVIKEMRDKDEQNGRTGADVRCRWVIWENVRGAMSSNGGEDFRCVLEEFAKIKDPEITIPRPKGRWNMQGVILGREREWSIAWSVRNARLCGVPQRRERIALVCDFGGCTAPEILFKSKSLPGSTEQGGGEREDLASLIARGIGISKRGRKLRQDNQGCNGKIPSLAFLERAGREGGGKGLLTYNDHTGTLATSQTQKIMDAKTTPLCNDTAGTLDSHYGLGHGMRGGVEREYVGDPICIGGGRQ